MQTAEVAIPLRGTFLIEEDVRVERRRACDYLNHEEVDGQ
jgi:hypothetical protein